MGRVVGAPRPGRGDAKDAETAAAAPFWRRRASIGSRRCGNLRCGADLTPEGTFQQQVRTKPLLWRQPGATGRVPAADWGNNAHENDTGFSPATFSQEAGSNRLFWRALLQAGAAGEHRGGPRRSGRLPPAHEPLAVAPSRCREERLLRRQNTRTGAGSEPTPVARTRWDTGGRITRPY